MIENTFYVILSREAAKNLLFDMETLRYAQGNKIGTE